MYCLGILVITSIYVSHCKLSHRIVFDSFDYDKIVSQISSSIYIMLALQLLDNGDETRKQGDKLVVI
jgi:hypothetical protein